MAKAKEYESIYQLPKFSHATGAVIHPPPFKHEKQLWQPDSNLQFDGSKLNLNVERYQAKNIAEHLVRPAIDENKLMKIREFEKSKSPLKDKKAKMSMKQEKEFKAD